MTDRQRIDKWLWHARVVRTRSAAAALAASGHVRVNGARIDAASRAVAAGDVVTVALDRAVRVLKVAGFAERRGPAEAARPLYEDLTEPAPARRRPPDQTQRRDRRQRARAAVGPADPSASERAPSIAFIGTKMATRRRLRRRRRWRICPVRNGADACAVARPSGLRFPAPASAGAKR